MATDYEQFSGWLKGLLKENRMKQADLARASGLDTGYISRVIRMERPPSPEFVKAVARALNVSEVEAMRQAGFLKPVPISNARRAGLMEQLGHLLGDFTDDELESWVNITRAQAEWNERAKTKKSGSSDSATVSDGVESNG